jgi:hypothetical protein
MSLTSYINYENERSLAFKFRQKRAERIKQLIIDCYNENNYVEIIDIGGRKEYWNIIPRDFLIEKNVHITIVNLPSEQLPKSDQLFSYYYGDGCDLINFSTGSFHIAHSNSVIEHVGSWENVVMFANEIKRVSETYYLQTPNYWFPFEPHFLTPFFHWLPKKIRIKLLLHFNLGWFKKAKNYHEAKKTVESCNLLSKKELAYLFPEAKLFKEKVMFLTKSLIVIK